MGGLFTTITMKGIKFFLILLLIGCNNSKKNKQVDYKPSHAVIDLNDTAVSIYGEQLHKDIKNILLLRKALSYLNKAIALDSLYVYSYLNKISIYKHLEMYDSAAAQYTIVSRIDSKKPEYILGEGILSERIGDSNKANEKYLAALELYNNLIKEKPKDIDLKINRVFAYLLLQGKEEAISHLGYISPTSKSDEEKIDRMYSLIEDFHREDFIVNF